MARPLRIEFPSALYHVTIVANRSLKMAKYPERDDAIVAAYGTGSYSYRQIAEHFDVHLATVGRIVRSRMLQGEN